MKRKKSLFWQLYFTYLLVVLLALVPLIWLGINRFEKLYYQQLADELATQAKVILPLLQTQSIKDNSQSVNQLINRLGHAAKIRLTVIADQGLVLADSEKNPNTMDNHSNRPEIITARTRQVGQAKRLSTTLNKEMMYVAVHSRDNRQHSFFIRAARPLKTIDQRLADHYDELAGWTVLIIVFLALFSFFITRKITGPINDITAGANRFAQGQLHTRLPVPPFREIAGLAQTLNTMGRQLDERIQIISRQRQEQTAMLTAMNEGVIAVGRQEEIIHINPSAASLFHASVEQAKGQPIQAIIRKPELIKFFSKVLKEQKSQSAELVFYEDGERTIHASGTPLQNEQGDYIGALLVLNDMTRQRQLENIRREFVANVSHELKTPITLIQGFVETLMDGAIDNKRDAQKFLDRILSNSKRLNLIIEDLLNLSRIEQTDERLLTMETVEIKDMLEQVINHYLSNMKDNRVMINLTCDESLTARVNRNLIEQAVVNLIDNAVKYSQTTEPIEITVTAVEDELRINIRDFGIGISQEHIPRLFERFYRIDKARSRHVGGTGLGLAIVKHIVQAHKGRITVESDINRGATFTLHLPCQ